MGLDIAKGTYIARMDGDDISYPARFEKQVKFMDEYPEIIVCGTGYQTIEPNTINYIPKASNEEILLDLISLNGIAHPTVILRNSILKNNNIKYDTQYEPAEDYKMWTILAQYGKLANLTEILLNYRIHPEQTSLLRAQKQSEIANRISIEFINKLSNNNSNSKIFYESRINTLEEFKKYEEVEFEILNNLIAKGIISNDDFFLNRKKYCLRISLTRNKYSIPFALKNVALIYRYRNLLGFNFIWKYFLKSILYWENNNLIHT